MNPGELRDRVQLWANVVPEGVALGPQGRIAEPTMLRPLFAKVEPISSSEYWEAQQTQSESTHRITVRFQADLEITSAHWLIWRDKRLDIDAAMPPDARREFVVILAHEHAN